MDKRQEFLQQIKTYIDFWDKHDTDKKDCLDGLAFSILVILDGESSINAFSVRPILENGEEGDDIAGGLHDDFNKM